MKTKATVKIRLLLALVALTVSILIPSISSTETHETSTVSRIVGESPQEMLRQMQKNTLEIDNAIYYSVQSTYNYKDDILKKQFGSKAESHLFDWDFDDVKSSISKLQKNELIIIETDGTPSPLTAKKGSSTLTPLTIRDWQTKVEDTEPLLLFESPYAGAYLPKRDSFVSRLIRDATIIAPTSINSKQFTKAFICSLKNQRTAGEAYREARNFFYKDGSIANVGNLVGAVLQSYAFYGNPFQTISMDFDDYEEIRSDCSNNHLNLAPNIEYLGHVGNYSKFRKHIVFEIPDYEISQVGNFSIINATTTFQNLVLDELVLPMAVRTTSFPLASLITNITLDLVTDPSTMTVKTLPSFNDGLVNRTCYFDNESYSITFENSFTQDTQDVIATIQPVQIINCTQGKFRLYKKFNYSVDYIAVSPIFLSIIESPFEINVNEKVDALVKVDPITNGTRNGTIIITNQNQTTLLELETNTTSQIYNVSFFAPPKEGLQNFNVEFIMENETMDIKRFSLSTTILKASASIPITVSASQKINLDFFSFYNQTFNLEAKYFILHNETIKASGNFSKDITPGNNTHPFTFDGLKREDQAYTLVLELNYLNHKRTENYLLQTNNVPLVYITNEPTFKENELVTINLQSHDVDNDSVQLTVNDSRFKASGNAIVWQTDYEDAGNYTVKVTANDNLIDNEQVTFFEVINVIPPYTFHGTINFQNGTSIPDNLTVQALINKTIVSTTATQDGTYNITIAADLLDTSTREGGKDNETIVIYVGTYNIQKNPTWKSGLTKEINFTILDLCANITCSDYCQSTTSHSQGSCLRGICSYHTTSNASTCGYGQGKFKISLINPPTNVSISRFFDFKVNVTCLNGSCGRINVTLDPAEIRDSPPTAGEIDNINGYCNVDMQADKIFYFWRWYRNGLLNSHGGGIDFVQEVEDAWSTEDATAGFVDAEKAVDEDWATHGEIDPFAGSGCSIHSYIYENFTIPHGVRQINWTIKSGHALPKNFTGAIPLDQVTNLSILQLRTQLETRGSGCSGLFSQTTKDINCSTNYWDGEQWRKFDCSSILTYTGTPFQKYYEGQVHWKFDSSPPNTNTKLSTIAGSNLRINDTWVFSCIGTDGEENSSWSNSSAITISDDDSSVNNEELDIVLNVCNATTSNTCGSGDGIYAYSPFYVERPIKFRLMDIWWTDNGVAEKTDVYILGGNLTNWTSTVYYVQENVSMSNFRVQGNWSNVTFNGTGNKTLQTGIYWLLVKAHGNSGGFSYCNNTCDPLRKLDDGTSGWKLHRYLTSTGINTFSNYSLLFNFRGNIDDRKGIIPEDAGTPFYVNSNITRNPANCNLNENQTCILNWKVNATGLQNSIHEFFVYGQSNSMYQVSQKVNITINSCITVVTNTSWSTWSNATSCFKNDSLVQQRARTQYDVNKCSNATNTTFTEYRENGCDACTPIVTNTSWSAWVNISDCFKNNTIVQNRTRIQYDQNFCEEVANFTFIAHQDTFCNYCTPDLVLNNTWSACDTTDLQQKNFYDKNSCNIPYSNISVLCQGQNNYNQTRNDTNASAIYIEAGGEHTCILRTNGNVDCVGRNSKGQSNSYTGNDAIQLSAGGESTCVRKINGNVECWGENRNTSEQNYTNGDATYVSTGADATCILKKNGNVVCWGYNAHGAAENYTGGDAISVSVGNHHVCILTKSKTVNCWGYNKYGQAATLLANDTLQVSSGGEHTCVMLSTGQMNCFGFNSDGRANNYSGTDLKHIAAGPEHSCMIQNNASVLCQGKDKYGETQIQGSKNAIKLAVGGALTCVLQEATSKPPKKQSCNHCTSTWENSNSSCQVGDFYRVNYNYTNTCCSDTGLNADCNIPANTTSNCAYVYNHTLALNPGWNLVSIPLIQENNTLQQILEPIKGKYGMILGYDEDGWMSLSNNSQLNTSWGFLIQMQQAASLEVKGTIIGLNNLSMRWGWNLLAHNGLNITNITEIYTNYTVYTWHNDVWYSYDPNRDRNSLNWLYPGRGYWIMKK